MILAFDLGLKATGIAHDLGSDVLLCPPGLRKSPMTDVRRAARREWWVTSFVRLVDIHRPDEVWVEAPILHMAHPSGLSEIHRQHGWLDAAGRTDQRHTTDGDGDSTSERRGVVNVEGLQASSARSAASMPTVTGRCPACGSSSLFLAVGGYVTCAVIKCPNPTAVSDSLLDDPYGVWT